MRIIDVQLMFVFVMSYLESPFIKLCKEGGFSLTNLLNLLLYNEDNAWHMAVIQARLSLSIFVLKEMFTFEIWHIMGWR